MPSFKTRGASVTRAIFALDHSLRGRAGARPALGVSLAALLLAGCAGGAPSGTGAGTDPPGAMSAGGATAQIEVSPGHVVSVDYTLNEQWVGAFSMDASRKWLTVATPEFSKTVAAEGLSWTSDPGSLAPALGVASDDASLARLGQAEAALRTPVSAAPPSRSPELRCTTVCCFDFQNATAAYLAGDTEWGAFYERCAGEDDCF